MPAPRRHRTRLRLDSLEDRTVPSTVTNLLDSGPGSLRDAIAATPAGGTVDFQPGLAGTITLTTRELAIDKDLTIAGPGAGVVTVSGDDFFRVFDITGPVTVALSGLTIAHGQSTRGGALINAGVLTVQGCTFRDNTVATPVFGSVLAQGGAIANTGTLTLTDSTLTNNSATTGFAEGGAIYNGGSATLSITRCTFNGNTATGSNARGGAIYNEGVTDGGSFTGGLLTVNDSIIDGNITSGTDASAGGGIRNGGYLTFTNSILSGNIGGGIGSQGSLTVIGSTIRGNSSGQGGGIESSGTFSTVTVTDSTISGNSAVNGGGGIDVGGSLIVTRSTISGNSAGWGGGVNLQGPSINASVASSTISDNTATTGGGGGVLNFGTLAVTSSTISGNSADSGPGGGIYSGGVLTITASTVSGNSADSGGGIHQIGGFVMIESRVTITSSTFRDNTSIGDGGAILAAGEKLTATNSTFAGNKAGNTNGGGSGGAIFATPPASVTVTNSTFSGNSATDRGGALFVLPGATLTMVNTIAAGNAAAAFPDVGGPLTSLGHNLVGDGTGASGLTDPGDQVGTAAAPIDPRLGPLQDNGRATFTMALLPGSPAIDAGDTAAAAGLASDQRGLGFARISNGVVDIGAFEVQVLVVLAPASLPDGRVGTFYSQEITASGPPGPYTFAVIAGALPPGLTLAGSGTLSGSPTQAGAFAFTVTAANGTAETGSRVYTLTVDPAPPQPAAVGGSPDGTARLLTPNGGQYDLGNTLTVFPDFAGVVRTAMADVTGDGVPDLVGGAGPGGGPRVAVIDGATGARVADFFAFEPTFTGGVSVAAGDLDGDGKAEVVVTPDDSGGPIVAVFSGAALTVGAAGEAAELARFAGIDDPAFRGGARAAVGDVDGDGTPDLAVTAGFGGGPRVAVFAGRSVAAGGPVRLVADFFAFEPGLRNGAFVAVGDVDGDGSAELALGSGADGSPRVRVVSGRVLRTVEGLIGLDPFLLKPPGLVGPSNERLWDLAHPIPPDLILADFFAGDGTLRGGVRVALKEVNGDGRADLETGSGEGEPSRVRVYRADTLLAGGTTPDQDLDPFGAVLADGVFVG